MKYLNPAKDSHQLWSPVSKADAVVSSKLVVNKTIVLSNNENVFYFGSETV